MTDIQIMGQSKKLGNSIWICVVGVRDRKVEELATERPEFKGEWR